MRMDPIMLTSLCCLPQDALSFAEWLVNDTSYEAWTPALAHLLNIRGLLFNDAGSDGSDLQCVADLNAYAQTLLLPLVTKLGWGNATDDDPPLNALLRSRALSAASIFNLSLVVQQAYSLFDDGSPTDILPNLQVRGKTPSASRDAGHSWLYCTRHTILPCPSTLFP